MDGWLEAVYEYDFGDQWIHDLLLEMIMPAESGQTYPRCIGGRRHCPPEDCGGPHGYQRFLEAMRNEADPEHDLYSEWVGGSFDPNEFTPSQVLFDDPKKRWRFGFMENNGGVSADDLLLPTRVRRQA